MTIIAYRDGVLAADTLSTMCGSRVGHLLKIERVDGWLIGGSGTVGVLRPAREWIKHGADVNVKLDFDKLEESNVIMINPDGDVLRASDASPHVFKVDRGPRALGSGFDAANGAFFMGATALQAVEVAIRVDVHCGGNVTWLSLDGREKLDLPDLNVIYSSVNST